MVMAETSPATSSPEKPRVPQSLLEEYEDFNERFDVHPADEDYYSAFYDEYPLGPVIQRNFQIESHMAVLREPAIKEPSLDFDDPAVVEELGEELDLSKLSKIEIDGEDEPAPAKKPFLFEISLLGKHGIRDWSLLVKTDGTYEATSRENYPDETIIEQAERTLRDLA